ncbi:Uncharacterized protein Rs2_13962 [Raphanus sativus]|nr:Uncharacterized protein Rs2_13962 [Raphanus sativus]
MLLFHLSKGLVADKIIEEESSLEEDEEDNQEPEVDVTQLTWRKNKLFELRLNMAMAEQIEQMGGQIENYQKKLEELQDKYTGQVRECSDLTSRLESTEEERTHTQWG